LFVSGRWPGIESGCGQLGNEENMNDHTSDIPQQEPHDSTGNPVAPKKSRWKKIIAVVLVVIVLATIGVVLAVTLNTHPDVVGSYKGDDGREITLDKYGIFMDITMSPWTLSPRGLGHYWVSGNRITIGYSELRPKVPTTFTIEKSNRLVGYGTAWVKQLVEPNRPSSLVGTYTASDGESLALNKNGAAYESHYESQEEHLVYSARVGTWVAGKNAVLVTYPDIHSDVRMSHPVTTTYAINGKTLVGGGKELVKTADDAIVPLTK
jgi:hypothetical protein